MRKSHGLALAALSLLPGGAWGRPDIRAARLRCEMLATPLAVDAPRPRLSWTVTSTARGACQTAYRVLVAASPETLARGNGDVWDSGQVRSSATLHIGYAGKALRSRMQYWWMVRVWDGKGRPSAWSAPARWSMGLLSPGDWKAKWIGCSVDRKNADDPTYLPAPLLRREFHVRGPLRRAVVYATAAGVYDLYLNGKRVGDQHLAPGWTEYHKRLYYQAYDVTSMLRPGRRNAIGAVLGDGWYGLHHRGRGRLALKAQLHLDYETGPGEVVATDSSWRTTDRSPIRMSDMYNGETYDARRAPAGWALPGFDVRAWKPVVVDFAGQSGATWKDVTEPVRAAIQDNRLAVTASNDAFGDPIFGVVKTLRVRYQVGLRAQERRVSEGQTLKLDGGRGTLRIIKAEYGADTSSADVTEAVLQAHPGSPVRTTTTIEPRDVREPKPGVFVYDIGQNMVGWARLRVRGPRGSTVTLRFAEMLNPDGTIYTANLRGARCTDRYTLSGIGLEVWEPRFTFHGFRYVEVTGYPGRPAISAIKGIVLSSDCGDTGRWECSDPLLNNLYRNIVWGQRGNYLEVPTDCPQRDERMGWSGDAQVFVGTGAYCMDIGPFFAAWMRTFNDSQTAEGGYPNVSPNGGGVSPAWGDAGLVCPWTIFRVYGDVRILTDHYDGMRRWVEYLRERSKDLVRPAEGFGDWLNVRDDTPRDVISTAFFARSAYLASEIAGVIGKRADQRRYADLYRRVGAAFTKEFVSDVSDRSDRSDGSDRSAKPGTIKGNSQTAYLLALEFDLLPERLRRHAFERLLENLEAHDWHLTVGFVGVDHLLPVLSRFGRPDVAWRLLTNRGYPSWLYSVTQGATTIWERWDGWRHDRGFQDPGMNSFNHYAFGACGKWMFSDAAGIAPIEPSFRRIRMKPTPGGGVSWLRASYDSVRGPISTYWRVSGERLQLDVTVPANTRALVHVPAVNARSVTEGGRPALETPGIRYVGMANGHAVFEVGGGTYRFGSRTVTARQRTASGKVVTGCPARTDGPSTVRGMHNGPGQTPPEDRS